MATLYPVHEQTASGRNLSQRLWRGFPLDEIFGGPNGIGAGVGIFDDFVSFDTAVDAAAATVLYGNGGQRCYIDSSCTITQLKYSNTLAASGAHGVLELATSASDNDEASIQWGGATGALFTMDDTAYTATTDIARDLAFEIRIRPSGATTPIGDNGLAFFVGLMEEASAIQNALVDDTGAVIDNDFIGFSKLHASGTDDAGSLDFTYKTDGQTVQAGGTGEGGIADFHTMAYNTWVKLGFRYNSQAKTVTAFLNGVPNSTIVTSTQTAAATFPDAQGLAPIIAVKNGTATAWALDVDWICVAQAEATGGVGNF
jgi:hypothetical protein